MKHSINVTHLLLVVGLASVLLLSGLGSIGLTDRDEGRNAEAGREMFESGDWITPMFNYEPRFIKPAMLYWLMSASYSIWGVNEFAARFPSAVCGIGLIALQYLFLVRVAGQRLALFGALMLLLNIEVIGLGRAALTDMVLMFFTTLAAYAFWLGFHGTSSRRVWLTMSFAAMACATLDKGPVGLLVPFLGIVAYLTVTKQWQRWWQEGFPLGGLAVFLAVALPWYATMLTLHGASYTSAAQEHTLSRYLNPFYGWGGTIFFYIPVLLLGFFPWSAFLPAALVRKYREWKRERHAGDAARNVAVRRNLHGDLELFAVLWFTAVFIFFSLGATRLPHYIGPLYPAAAIVTAYYWLRAEEGESLAGYRGAVYTMLVLGLLLAAVLAAVPLIFAYLAPKLAKSFPFAEHFEFGLGPYLSALLAAGGTGLAAYWGLINSMRHRLFGVAGATWALVVLVTLHVTLPTVGHYFLSPPQALASVAGELLKSNDHLVAYGPVRPSVVFYARRKVVVIHQDEEENIPRYVRDPGRTMILLPTALRDRLPPEAAGLQTVQERFGWVLVAEDL